MMSPMTPTTPTATTIKVLVVDDENTLARNRLRTLLKNCTEPSGQHLR